MVQLDFVRATNSELAKRNSLTAVFTGGTSGIGEYAIRTLVDHYKNSDKDLRIFIVGRNVVAATRITSECKEICPDCQIQFVEAADLSLLRDVDQCCEKLTRLLNNETNGIPVRIDLLFMTHADLHFGARRETEEGIDKTMSLLYYSRIRFIVNLLPLLRKSTLPAHVVSVYGAGLEKGLPKFFADDLSLRDPKHYGLISYRTHVAVMKTFMFEQLAKENARQVSFIHVFPSLVITPAFDSSSHPLWFKVLWTILSPGLKYFVAISAEETGERMIYLASYKFSARHIDSTGPEISVDNSGDRQATLGSDGVEGGGAYSVNPKGETNQLEDVYATLRQQNFGEKVQGHTQAALDAAGRGEKFSA